MYFEGAYNSVCEADTMMPLEIIERILDASFTHFLASLGRGGTVTISSWGAGYPNGCWRIAELQTRNRRRRSGQHQSHLHACLQGVAVYCTKSFNTGHKVKACVIGRCNVLRSRTARTPGPGPLRRAASPTPLWRGRPPPGSLAAAGPAGSKFRVQSVCSSLHSCVFDVVLMW